MKINVLVAYASKYGATKEIAEKIGRVLKDASCTVDVLPAEKVTDLAPYRAVVLGSAVYIGRWLMRKVKAPRSGPFFTPGEKIPAALS